MPRTLCLNDILNPVLELIHDLDEHILLENYKSLSDKDKRSYIRNLYPYLEGATHQLRQICLYAARNASRPELSQGEFILLLGESYELLETGKVKVSKKNVTLTASIRLTHRLLNQLYGTTVELEFDTAGWQALKRYITTRHRVTHPKSKEDYNISESDWKDCHEGLGWFNNMVAQHIKAIINNSVKHKLAMDNSKPDSDL